MCLHDGHRDGPGQETRFGRSQAPPTKRGAEITAEAGALGAGTYDPLQMTLRIDYLSGVFECVPAIADLLDEVAALFGICRDELVPGEGWNSYLRSWRAPGILIGYDREYGGAGGRVKAPHEAYVSFTGEGCAALGMDKVRKWCKRLPRATRVDVALDVPERWAPTPWELAETWYNETVKNEEYEAVKAAGERWEKGRAGIDSKGTVRNARGQELVARTRSGEEGSFRTSAKNFRQMRDQCGQTMYIGTRESSRFMRIYNRRAGIVRFELESHDENADDLRQMLAGWGDAVAIGVGKLVDFCDFVEPSSNACRASKEGRQAAWWKAIVGNFARIRTAAAEVSIKLEDTMRWLQDQVGPSLVACLIATGGELRWLLEDAEDRMSERLKGRLAQYVERHAQGTTQPAPS